MLNHVNINKFWDLAQESTSFHACLKNVCMWDTCTENCCDEKIHLYYFHHFICNLITRLYYLVMCSISNSNSNSILISILYIVFIYISHLHICSLHYSLSTHSLHLFSSQTFHSRSYSSFLQCIYSSFSYIFVNAVVIHIWYCLYCSLYHIQYFVFDYYIWYLSLLLMRFFIIFHI